MTYPADMRWRALPGGAQRHLVMIGDDFSACGKLVETWTDWEADPDELVPLRSCLICNMRSLSAVPYAWQALCEELGVGV